MTARALLLVGLAGLAAAPAQAQAPAVWSAQALGRVEAFRADREPWREARVAVQRRGPRGAVGVEAARVERNGRTDAMLAVDLYRVLSRRVYANVRAEAAPQASVVPAVALLGEVYAGLGGGWEASAGARFLSVPGADVVLVVASATRTVGPFALGVRSSAALRPAVTVSTALTARFAPETPSRGPATRASITLGQGQEAVVDADGAVAVRRQFVAAVSGQRTVAGALGVLGGVAYVADGPITRWSAEAGVAVRF